MKKVYLIYQVSRASLFGFPEMLGFVSDENKAIEIVDKHNYGSEENDTVYYYEVLDQLEGSDLNE